MEDLSPRPTPAYVADIYLEISDRNENEEEHDHDEVVGVRPYMFEPTGSAHGVGETPVGNWQDLYSWGGT